MAKIPTAKATYRIRAGYLYGRGLCVTTLPDGRIIVTIKIGKTLDLKVREAGYRRWARSYKTDWGSVFCVVKVDNYTWAETRLKQRFKKYNVASEFNKKARKAMSPEMAKAAETFGDGTEMLRGVTPEAVREFLLQLGEEV